MLNLTVIIKQYASTSHDMDGNIFIKIRTVHHIIYFIKQKPTLNKCHPAMSPGLFNRFECKVHNARSDMIKHPWSTMQMPGLLFKKVQCFQCTVCVMYNKLKY